MVTEKVVDGSFTIEKISGLPKKTAMIQSVYEFSVQA